LALPALIYPFYARETKSTINREGNLEVAQRGVELEDKSFLIPDSSFFQRLDCMFFLLIMFFYV
jgi:hypothetical protein